MTPLSKPFESSGGRFHLDDGSSVRYNIKKTSMPWQPISLTFTALKKDGAPTGSLETDSTLYFDAAGNIVDRAPMNMHTNVLALKRLYGIKLAAFLDQFEAQTDEEKRLIRGFLLPGEEGIARVSEVAVGKARRILRREDL